MRIISDFRDFYDCMQSYGQDDLVYIRKTVEIRGAHRFQYWHDNDAYIQLSTYQIGFCGNIYVCVRDSVSGVCAYNIESLDKFMADNAYDAKLERYQEDGRWGKSDRKDWIKKFNEPENHWKPIFEEESCPIFVVYPNGRIVINGRLKYFQFYKKFDITKTWQELNMYIGNMYKPDIQPPQPDDKTMLEIKGFDKYSFKKGKSK